MSLVTRCTSCGTLFKVVADQLKISEGWVRCGQCATVFDAQANLVEAPPAPPIAPVAVCAAGISAPIAPSDTDNKSLSSDSIRDSAFNPKDKEALLAAFEPYRTSSSTFSSTYGSTRAGAASAPATFNKSARSQPISIPEDLSEGFSSGFSESVSENPVGSPQPAQLGSLKSGVDTAIPDSQSFRPGLLRGSDEIDSDAGPSSSSWASSEYGMRAEQAAVSFSAEPTTMHSPSSINASTLPEPDLASLSTTPDSANPPSFVKQAQRAQHWRSPAMRFVLSLVGLALLAALAAQIALHDKDRLAAQWPQTKPWLDQLCQHAGCKVEALRRIEAIAVDASSFNRINKNNAQLEAVTQSYRLAVTLKNTAALPVALPHVELSLQDAQDQSILRRVLSPADLGSSLQALGATQEMAGSLTLQIDTASLAGSRIQGYRVLAFYP